MEHAGRKGCYSEREVMGHKRHSSNPEDPRTVNGTVEEIAGLLLRCEDEGVAPRYRSGESDPVRLETGGADIFVVSDLHAAGGRNNSGVFGGTENFYADVAFRRFLDHAHHSLDGKSGVVVINGDFVDFLRIVSVPEPGEIGMYKQLRSDYQKWSKNLWAYIHVYDVARAVRQCAECSELSVHDSFFICAPETWTDSESRSLAAEFFPETKAISPSLSGNFSFISSEKARKAFGFSPAYTWRDIIAGQR